MTLPQIKTQLFALLRVLQIGIIALVIVLVMVIHPGHSGASQGSRSYQAHCALPSIIILRDGQGLDRGRVAVWNDTASMYVQFFANENWTLTTTHVHITTPLDTVLVTNQSTFMHKQFDAMTDHPQIMSYVYTIPLTWPEFTELTIMARGSVISSGGVSESTQTSTVWSGKLDNTTRQTYFDYTIKHCTDESNPKTSDSPAKADSASGDWDHDQYDETLAIVPAHTVSNRVSDPPRRSTKAPRLDTARIQGPNTVGDTWLGSEIMVVLDASTGVLNHLRFAGSTARTVHDTLMSLQQQIMLLMRDSLNMIKPLVMPPEQKSMPVLDWTPRMTR